MPPEALHRRGRRRRQWSAMSSITSRTRNTSPLLRRTRPRPAPHFEAMKSEAKGSRRNAETDGRTQTKAEPIYSTKKPQRGKAKTAPAFNLEIKTATTLQESRPKMLAHGMCCSYCHQVTRVGNARLGNLTGAARTPLSLSL